MFTLSCLLWVTVKEGVPENDDENANEECSFKEGKPNDLALNELAGKIAAKWQTLGLYLGIGQDILDVIDANEKDKSYRMLLHWKNRTASNSLYQDLYNALCYERVGLNNVAKEFCCKKTTWHGAFSESVTTWRRRHTQKCWSRRCNRKFLGIGRNLQGRWLLENEEALDATDKEDEKYSEKAYKMLLRLKETESPVATFFLSDALFQ